MRRRGFRGSEKGYCLMVGADEFSLYLHPVARLWRHGSVVRSWPLDLLARPLEEDRHLETIAGYVEDSGEGRWTVDRTVDIPSIALSLFARFASRQDDSFSAKVVASLRHRSGDHEVQKE